MDDVFVALASNLDSIGTIYAVKIDGERLAGIQFDDEPGDTPAVMLNSKHHNILDLNYVSLGDVIGSILDGLAHDGLVKKTRGEMKKLLAGAYTEGKLDGELLSPHLKAEIEKELARGQG